MGQIPDERTTASDQTSAEIAAGASPNLALLHVCMLLAGFGTVFLGPTLPVLAASAHASDSGSGLFFTAQFVGAFFGGVTTSSRLWFSLIRGSAAATFGFALLGACALLHASLLWDAAALLPLGFGVGQMLTAVNLLASQRFATSRGSALSLVNLSWSLGAVCAPFLLGSLLPHVRLGALLVCAAAIFASACLASIVNARGFGPARVAMARGAIRRGLPKVAFVYFGFLLLLYGGVETCIGGWITTFGTRYGSGALQISALGESALWIGITSGRALAPLLLKVMRERTLLISTLLTATALTAMLSRANGAAAITLIAGLLGVALAPWFPLVLSAMLGEGAAAGEVGTIIAVSGIGAATLPLLLGTVSRASGSLRIALLVPLCGLLLLFALSFRRSEPLPATEIQHA
ncbi:fucose permease [Terriglobus roseus DSM 18391]|uniref:Fucose permease n=1 Tax=Terriglobus roseus (strain DSM 18391 / NRRL B-41598 / KBS 63) TaxID=926566 RepID=I3ZEK9_TERRK|nr:MFS transporter [Terriglobus roseus]AFL87677.1 fucose permease [Terriglobus roseus DSM 18391]